MKLRHYRPDDAGALATIMRRSIESLGPRHYTTEQMAAWAAAALDAEEMALRLGDGRTVLVAVDAHDQAVAFGDLEAHGHIDLLFALPEAAGRGVAAAILEALEMVARTDALMQLTVEASEGAKGLFTRQGFMLVARNDLTLGGVAIHNWRMEKRLQRQSSSHLRLPSRG